MYDFRNMSNYIHWKHVNSLRSSGSTLVRCVDRDEMFSNSFCTTIRRFYLCQTDR